MDLSKFGGKQYESRLAYADPNIDNESWNFGIVLDQDKTREQLDCEELIRKSLQDFKIQGNTYYGDEKKVALFSVWGHPLVVSGMGYAYPGNHQFTGSCVGAGGGNALTSLIIADAVIRKDPESVFVPFWLYPYGRSRFYLGYRSQGEGSSGTTFAQALRDDGCLPAKTSGLPSFTNEDGLCWGASVEMKWSSGVGASQDVINSSKKNVVKSTALLKSSDDVREAICNWYSVSCASNWGGMMKPPVTEGVLLNKRVTSWNHQMSVHAWWEHPKLGEIFWIQNNWGVETHGRCPSGAPGGGFWVAKSDMDYIVRQNETFAFSQWDGYPAQKVEWYI